MFGPFFGPVLGTGVKNTKKKMLRLVFIYIFVVFLPKYTNYLGPKIAISKSNEMLEIGSKFEKCQITGSACWK